MSIAGLLRRASSKCRTIDKVDIFGDNSGVALYRLDGNANDESGNYHGTETAVTYGGGVYERGAVFNGSSSLVSIGTVLGTSVTVFSFSGWINRAVLNVSHTIIDINSASDSNRFLVYAYSVNNKLVIYNSSNGTSYETANAVPTWWFHLSIIRNTTGI